MKAWNFKKFEPYANNIVKESQFFLWQYMHIHSHKRRRHAHACFVPCQRIYALCARVSAWILLLYYLMSLSFKFHIDLSVFYGDICNHESAFQIVFFYWKLRSICKLWIQFLCNFRVMRNLQNKIGFLTKLLWSNSNYLI